MAAHLYGVAGFGWPAELIMHDKVHCKHVEALKRKKAHKIRIYFFFLLFLQIEFVLWTESCNSANFTISLLNVAFDASSFQACKEQNTIELLFFLFSKVFHLLARC